MSDVLTTELMKELGGTTATVEQKQTALDQCLLFINGERKVIEAGQNWCYSPTALEEIYRSIAQSNGLTLDRHLSIKLCLTAES